MGEKFDPYYKWLGIPPKDQPPHNYRLLGIEIFETDREVIDAAANRLMGYLKDLAVGDEGAHTQDLLNEIARARICLLNKENKTAYDRELCSQLEAEEARTPTAKGPPPKPTKRTVPPPAAPPSAVTPPSVPPPELNLSVPIVTDPAGLPKTTGTAASPDDAFKIVAVQDKGPRSTVKSPPHVDAGDRKRTRQPVANASPPPARTRRHGRDVYVAATLIAVVGGIGLILIIVMSYLLLTSDGSSSGSAQATGEPAVLVLEMSGEQRGSVTEFLLNDVSQPLPLKDEYVLEAGRHRVVLKRTGCEDFFDSPTLVAGQRKTISPQWIRTASPSN